VSIKEIPMSSTTQMSNDADVEATKRMIADLAAGASRAERLAQWWRSRAVFHSENTPAQHAPVVPDEDCAASHPDRAGVAGLMAMAGRWRAEARDAWTLAGIYARRAELLRQAQADASEHLDEITRPAGHEET
jgi:hypothetical protein